MGPFDQTNIDIRAVYRVISWRFGFGGNDTRTCRSFHFKMTHMFELPELVQCLASSADDYPKMLTIMARILAAKPHPADVERCIRANNLLKTSLRARLDISTENAYLFIHHNLPPTAVWDPKPSVVKWLRSRTGRSNRRKQKTTSL